LLATWIPKVYLEENMPSDRKCLSLCYPTYLLLSLLVIYMRDEEDVRQQVKRNKDMGVHAIKVRKREREKKREREREKEKERERERERET